MAEKLKPYEKAGRVIRLLAWFSILGIAGIVAALLIPMSMNPKSPSFHNFAAPALVLALVCLFTYFQFALGAAIKAHKPWGRKAGIAYGALQLLGFPIGTLVGAYVLYCLIKGWDETPA